MSRGVPGWATILFLAIAIGYLVWLWGWAAWQDFADHRDRTMSKRWIDEQRRRQR